MPALALIAGLGIGAFAARHRASPPPPALPNEPPASLGEKLMARVGKRFVAMRGSLESGVTFYDTPKPYQRALCRVNAYFVPAKIIAGAFPAEGQEFWEDNLTIQMRFGVWTTPGGPDRSEAEAVRACAAYRDFDDTFFVDEGASAQRAAELMQLVLQAARSSTKPAFPIACQVMKSAKEVSPCDGKARLRSWSLKQLSQVRTESEQYQRTGWLRKDRLMLSLGPDWRQSADVLIESWDPFEGKLAIRSAIVTVDDISCHC